ncbi:hypothetical protein ACTMTU_21415 [Streptomyces sp. OZ13]|uniref:hypothetical protein n=1 Tax=Streptomyces sp. OZ13 TaxID=3452210 RepID=UPI003F8AF861
MRDEPRGSRMGTGLFASASAFGAQVVVLMVGHWWLPVQEETYYAPGPAVGLLFVAPLAPLFLAVVGFGHALAMSLPAILLGRLAARRRPPAWCWSLAAAASLSLLYALLAWVNGASYPVALLWTLGSSVLPILFGHHAIHRAALGGPRLHRRLIGELTLGTAVCAALAMGLITLGLRTGHLKQYEPPEISRTDAVGTWRIDGGGTEVRLVADGRGSFRSLPYFGSTVGETEFCDGDGTWSWRGHGPDDRDAVEFTVQGCQDARDRWTFSGTRDRLELFVVIGDPDSGDLYILRKG